jgi:hypothetical protein
MWIIQDGLKAGENVVVAGTQKVTSGMTVNPTPFIAKESANLNIGGDK